MASILTYCIATEQNNYVHLSPCALHLSAHSHTYNNLKAANTSSGVLSIQEAIVSQTATQTIAGADEMTPRRRITLLFFCPLVFCSSNSLCHRSTSSRCDGSIVDVSHALCCSIRMTVCQPYHHHTVINSSATALYQPTHVHILKQSTGTVNNVHCLYDWMSVFYDVRRIPKTLTALYQTKCGIFFLLYRKGRKVYFLMVLKYDSVSTLY